MKQFNVNTPNYILTSVKNRMLKSNEYIDGKVTSIALQTEKLPAMVGANTRGDCTFNTADNEWMNGRERLSAYRSLVAHSTAQMLEC